MNESKSRFQDFLKYVGFQLPDTWTSQSSHSHAWKFPKERPKVATYQSRSMAALNSILHLVPLSGAIVLLILFWSKKWTDNPSDNATTLQFVAKLHEMLMQASLVAILLHIIRDQALNSYIPLGALSAAVKGPQLSYLWSTDFVSAVMSATFGMQRKVMFVLSTSGLLFLTAVVGPSSAVLMIPRPGMPCEQAKVARYTNLSELEVFPSKLNHSHELNLSTTNSFNVSAPLDLSIKGETLLGSFTWPDTHEVTRIAKVSVIKVTSVAVNYSQATVTMPTTLSRSQLLQQLENLPLNALGTRQDNILNSTLAISTLQPVALVMCTTLSAGGNEDVHFVLRNGSRRFLSTAADMFERMAKSNRSVVLAWAPPLWMQSPEDPSLVGVFLHTSLQNNETRKAFATCTVSSFWRSSKTWMKLVGARVEPDFLTNKDLSRETGLRPITIAPEGIALTNSAEWFSEILESPLRPKSNPEALGMSFVSAISEIPGSIRGPADDASGTIHSACCKDDLVKGLDRSQTAEGISVPLFDFVATSYGYGYGAIDTSICLSVAMITAYCIVALLYVTYIITTGHTSVAWGSATEFIVLALQSREPTDLGHVSVGLASMETFRRGVGIRVSSVSDDEAGVPREKLELVIEDDEDSEKTALRKVVRNKAY